MDDWTEDDDPHLKEKKERASRKRARAIGRAKRRASQRRRCALEGQGSCPSSPNQHPVLDSTAPAATSVQQQSVPDEKIERLVTGLIGDAEGRGGILELPVSERMEAIRELLVWEEVESPASPKDNTSIAIDLNSQGVSFDMAELVSGIMDAIKAYEEANKVEVSEPKSDFREDCENFFQLGRDDGKDSSACPQGRVHLSNESCTCKAVVGELVHTGNYYPARWRVHWLVSIEMFTEEECEVHSIDSYSDPFEARGETPKFNNYRTSEGEVRAAYIITRFVTHKETNRKYVIKQSIDCDGDPRCDVYHDSREGIEDLAHRIEDYANCHGPMKGGVCTVAGKFLRRDESVSDNIVLSERQKDVVERHIVSFIDNMPTYVERGLPNSRGILIAGPPGTGKTMLCKAIVGDTELSTIFVSGDLVGNPGTITSVYAMARKISPSLVIIEDLDTLGGQHRQQQTHPFLSEYLNALNGTEDNEGVFTIATTNLVGELDPALSDRPGRFDVIMRMETPDRDLRGKLLDSLSGSFNIAGDASLTSVARRGEGLTGAWLREVLITAELNALQDGSDVIRDFDLERALNDVNDRRAICREPTEISMPNCSDMSELYA
jgi:hypothetical protein